jgi:hypothetical protein
VRSSAWLKTEPPLPADRYLPAALADYEQKSSELALVLQTEKDNLQSVEKEIQSLQSGKPALAALVAAAELYAEVVCSAAP